MECDADSDLACLAGQCVSAACIEEDLTESSLKKYLKYLKETAEK